MTSSTTNSWTGSCGATCGSHVNIQGEEGITCDECCASFLVGKLKRFKRLLFYKIIKKRDEKSK